MNPVINIGLNVNGVRELTATEILKVLRTDGVQVIRWEVKESNTELTLVAEIEQNLTEWKGWAIAVALRQDAIAQVDSHGHGELFGPKAKEWGPFNPDYFLTL